MEARNPHFVEMDWFWAPGCLQLEIEDLNNALRKYLLISVTNKVESLRQMPKRRRPRSVEPNILVHPITEANLEALYFKPKIVRPMGYFPHRQ